MDLGIARLLEFDADGGLLRVKKVLISGPSPQTENLAKRLNQGATGSSGFFSSHVSN